MNDEVVGRMREDNNNDNWCQNYLRNIPVSSKPAFTSSTNPNKNLKAQLRVLSFNVLAESYTSPRSHKDLPDHYADVIFNPQKRRSLLMQTLQSLSCGTNEELNYDILCLQELDLYEECVKALPRFSSCHSKLHNRVDRCAIFWRKDKYELIESEVIEFDDLAHNFVDVSDVSSSGQKAKEVSPIKDHSSLLSKKKKTPSRKSDRDSSKSNNHQDIYNLALRSMASSFLRRNSASAAILQEKRTKQKFVIVSAHLYWNPGFEYVKLAQSKYLLERIHTLANNNANNGILPVIICGDLNSLPNSPVHTFMSKKIINARKFAPWRSMREELDEVNHSRKSGYTSSNKERNEVISKHGGLRDKLNTLSKNFEHLRVTKRDPLSSDETKYMCDYTLNRFARWLRILGIDAALETLEEEKIRTKQKKNKSNNDSGDSKIPIFDHCRNEGRVLLTTSPRLLHRKDCPPGAYLVDANQPEASFCHILYIHGVVLRPKDFISRCVVCNGHIVEVDDKDLRKELLLANKAPPLEEECIYSCVFCLQAYWWSTLPTSATSRVKNTCAHLLELALRSGIPYEGELGMFDYIDLSKKKQRKDTGFKFPRVEAIDWLNQAELKHPFDELKSAYADENGGEIIPFTNVTSTFVGLLDYIFYDSKYLTLLERLQTPTSFTLLNPERIKNGHLLPSCIWPSDHIAIGAVFSLN